MGDTSCPPYDNNCYEKDVNDEFEKFVAEWKYENGIEKLQTCIYDYTTLSDDVNDRIIIPDGYYVFEKQ